MQTSSFSMITIAAAKETFIRGCMEKMISGVSMNTEVPKAGESFVLSPENHTCNDHEQILFLSEAEKAAPVMRDVADRGGWILLKELQNMNLNKSLSAS